MVNGGTKATWVYDIVRDSHTGDEDTQTMKDGVTPFVDGNRSPDIVLGTKTVATNGSLVNGLKRMDIGTEVDGEIKNARPGDAIVMGGKGTDSGLKVTNNSNLTVKVKLTLKDSNSINELTKLTTAGWQLWVGGKLIDTSDLSSEAAFAAKIPTLATLAPGTSTDEAKSVRLELPLETDNNYQSKSADPSIPQDEKIVKVTDFNINNLFRIVATQENNPGWKENGDD